MVQTGVRVRAPRLQGAGGWINTDHPLDLVGLRGRVVVLDFWTFACVNCLHVIDELRVLEAAYPDDVVVIGVHSPKFAHEAEHAAVVAAVVRLDIRHPVLDDPQMATWRQYAVKAWPTLVVIDPDGYVVAQAAGEGQVSALQAIIAELLASRQAQHRPGAEVTVATAPAAPTGPLYFPAKAIVLPAARTGRAADSLLVADSGRHALTELSFGGETVLGQEMLLGGEMLPGGETVLGREMPLGGETLPGGEMLLGRIGAGERGRLDGPADSAEFAEPGGLTLLPSDVAAKVGYDVLVADTANHLLRGLRLADHTVTTVVDLTKVELETITGRVPGVMSPWDVAWWPGAGTAVIAAAGVHLLLSFDPRTGAVSRLAGTTVEGLRDGPALDAWLAQPSGLAADDRRLWFADAETSALRWLDLHGQVHTAIGEGLFDFGHVDGPAAQARLQHPLGVAVLPDGSLAIADTFNGAVRRFDPGPAAVTTLADGLGEPSGLVVVGDHLVVVESSIHRLSALSLNAVTTTAAAHAGGTPMKVARPVTDLRPGHIELRVAFTPAPGRVVDDRFGPATRLDVSASPPELLTAGTGASEALARTLHLATPATSTIPTTPTGPAGPAGSGGGGSTTGVLHVSAQAASCDHEPNVANPACYLSRQDWGIPFRITADGADKVDLILLG